MGERLAGKVCLITGSTGIAAATAQRAVDEGAKVFITSRTEANCARLAGRLGKGAAYLAADLKAEEAVTAAVQACVDAFGRIDAVFNVAGISGRRFGDGPLHECSVEGWEVTMDTNVKSMFLVCRAALKQMLAQEPGPAGQRGAILNMGSVLGYSPERNFFTTHAYAASKGAIISMSKAMAAYYAPQKIRVNVIAPALVETPMSQRAQTDAAILEFMRSKQPLKEGLISAEEVAEVALFLLGDEARAVTGDVYSVDAGWSVS